jgi:hypothetical protein
MLREQPQVPSRDLPRRRAVRSRDSLVAAARQMARDLRVREAARRSGTGVERVLGELGRRRNGRPARR